MKLINSVFNFLLNFIINIFKGCYLLKNTSNLKFLVFLVVGVGLMLLVMFKQDINPTVRFFVFWLSIPISLNLICNLDNRSIKTNPIKENEAVCINNADNKNDFNNYELSTKVSHIERCTVTTKEVKEIIYFKGDN